MKQKIDIQKVIPNKNNPRFINDSKFDRLVKSIKDFPEMLEKRPIVIDENYMVLGGNMRLKACKKAGLKEIWIDQVKDWSEEKKNEFIIKDNSGFGEWDWDILLNEWEAKDLYDWGLDIPEIPLEDIEVEEDNYEEPDELQVDVVLGDLIEIGDHRLLCGDSTDVTQIEKLMNGQEIDLLYTDPPYGISVVNKKGSIGKGIIAKEGIYKQVIGDDKYFDPTYLLNIGKKQVIWGANYFHDKLPLETVWIVWDKDRPQGTTFSDCELAWTNKKGVAIKKYKCTWHGMVREGENDKRVHPTQKPLKISINILEDFSIDGDLIADLFLGSGSTMVAAHQIKRKCYGMELDPHYCQVIIDRMQKLDPDIEIKINGKEYLKN